MRYSKLIVFAASVFVLVAGPRTAEAKTVVDKIAIVVNDTVVTLSEYRKKEERIRRQSPQIPRKEVVNTVISEILIRQAAAKSGTKVSEQEIKAAISEFKRSLNVDDAGLVKMLSEKNTGFNEFFEEIQIQILTRKLVQHEVVQRGLSIDDERIEQEYMRANPNADRAAQVRIAHILMPRDSDKSLEEAKKIAETVKSRGEDFTQFVKKHSIDTRTSDKGGDLGYFRYDELIKPLLKAVDGARTGDINGPVESKSGFHIVKVLAIKEDGVLVPPEIKNALLERLAMRETERIISSIIEEGFETSLIDVRI